MKTAKSGTGRKIRNAIDVLTGRTEPHSGGRARLESLAILIATRLVAPGVRGRYHCRWTA